MKNKTGFTLIELLAVIVVLAIIALIATPIVMNTIKKAKQGAAERSADSYVKQVEVAVAEERLNKNEVLEGEYQITSDGNLCRDKSASCSDDKKIKIEMNGTKPTSGKIKITNGSVDQASSSMTIGDYELVYDQTSKSYKVKAPYAGVLCKANTSKASALVWNNSGDPVKETSYKSEEVGLLASEATSAYTPGVTYTCELGDGKQNTFYVLETNGDNVSLILGMNLGGTVAWSADKSNHKEDDEALQAAVAKAALKERTSAWTKLKRSQIVLPTYDQIYKAAGNKTSGFPTWLKSYTEFTEGAIGYWTSTYNTNDKYSAWSVIFSGILSNGTVDDQNYWGIRPIITVAKSQLS